MRFLLVFSALLIAGCANQEKAERFANDYAAEFYEGQPVNNVKCELGDSDNNGRVRCVLSLGAEPDLHVENIECPSGWLWQPLKTTCVGIRGGR